MSEPLSNKERQKNWRERKAGRMKPPDQCIDCGKILRGKHNPFCSRCWLKTPDGKEWQRLRMTEYRKKLKKNDNS